jgi:hypothetical protein
MGTTCASLRADAAKAVNRAYAKFGYTGGEGGKQVILLTRAGEGVAWRAC